MNKEQVFARRNLNDAVAKYQYVTSNVDAYTFQSYWSDCEIRGEWYNTRRSCVKRIKNALCILYPKQSHKELLDKYCPGWTVV